MVGLWIVYGVFSVKCLVMIVLVCRLVSMLLRRLVVIVEVFVECVVVLEVLLDVCYCVDLVVVGVDCVVCCYC